MNRRDFLAAGFKLGVAGLLLPVIEPARKVWALDRTMIPRPNPFAGKVVIGGWERDDTAITEYWDIITVPYDTRGMHDIYARYLDPSGREQRIPMTLRENGMYQTVPLPGPGILVGLEYTTRRV